METGFKNVMEGEKPKAATNPWSFEQPPYDMRSSCFVSAGSHHGVGHTQPVGTKKVSMNDHVPTGKVKTLKTELEKYGVTYLER